MTTRIFAEKPSEASLELAQDIMKLLNGESYENATTVLLNLLISLICDKDNGIDQSDTFVILQNLFEYLSDPNNERSTYMNESEIDQHIITKH